MNLVCDFLGKWEVGSTTGQHRQLPFSIFGSVLSLSIVKLRYRSGEGQVRVRKVKVLT